MKTTEMRNISFERIKKTKYITLQNIQEQTDAVNARQLISLIVGAVNCKEGGYNGHRQSENKHCTHHV
jgi:hypothetical protein